MTVHSGKWAAIDGFDTIENWSINDAHAPAMAVASNTAFAPVRRKGVRSWSGSYKGFGGQPAMMPGQVAAFVGYGAPADDSSGNGVRYSGNIMADSVALTWNWRTGEIINHTVNFTGHLALAIADGAQVVDAAVPDMPSIALAALPNVAQITLTFSAQNQNYINSDTVLSGIVWTGRKAGRIDWTAAITQEDDIRVGATVPQIGDDIELKLFINATEFWLLDFGHVRDYTGINANRSTGAILARTVNVDMTAWADGGVAIGQIVKPDTTVWWPPA